MSYARKEKNALIGLIRACAVTFLLPMLAYLAWKQWHFGTIVPNPFYIKASRTGFYSSNGLTSILDLLRHNVAIILLALLSPLAPRTRQGGSARAVAALFVVAYVLFYVRVDTLMDYHGRFLYPVVVFLVYLALPSLCWLFEHCLAWRLTGVVKTPALCVGVVVLFYCLPWGKTWTSVKQLLPRQAESAGDARHGKGAGTVPVPLSSPKRNAKPLMEKEYEAALALSRYDGIRDVRIAFGDAGVIPYFTEAFHLDVVGLNDRFIARERDLPKLVDYFFKQKPDLIMHAAQKDHAWITYGHGPLGNYARWSRDKRWDAYSYAGTLTTTQMYDIHLFVRDAHEQSAALRSFIRRNVADGYYRSFPIAIGSYTPPEEAQPEWVTLPRP